MKVMRFALLLVAGAFAFAPNKHGFNSDSWHDDDYYCCMAHKDITTFAQDIQCVYENGWSYCCPSGGSPDNPGSATCRCMWSTQTFETAVEQECDVINVLMGHWDSWDDIWRPDFGNGDKPGVCKDNQKDDCGCCPGWGWDDDSHKCRVNQTTDWDDSRFCKAVKSGNKCDAKDKDACGCCPFWGMDDDSYACEPGETTDPSTAAYCNSVKGVRRRALGGLGWDDFNCEDEKKDACGCCPGWGWDDWRCERFETTSWEDKRECEALANGNQCLETEKDDCGCCPGWGWDDYSCEPGETTDWEDRRECKMWLGRRRMRRLEEHEENL